MYIYIRIYIYIHIYITRSVALGSPAPSAASPWRARNGDDISHIICLYVYVYTHLYIPTDTHIYIHAYISHALSLSAHRCPAAACPRRARNGEARQHTRTHIHMHTYLILHTYIMRVCIAMYSYIYLSIPSSVWHAERSQW